jgi:hypothetical protein
MQNRLICDRWTGVGVRTAAWRAGWPDEFVKKRPKSSQSHLGMVKMKFFSVEKITTFVTFKKAPKVN